MNPPPGYWNPFVGVENPAFPVPGGAIAGTFNAFGWFRGLFTGPLPTYIAECEAITRVNP